MNLTHEEIDWLYQELCWLIIDFRCPDIAYAVRDKLRFMSDKKGDKMNKAMLALELVETALKHSTEIFDLVDEVDADVLKWRDAIKKIHDEVKTRNEKNKT